MTKWMSRFALLAVVGGLLASMMVVGCGGTPPEEPAPAVGSGNASS